MALTIKRTATQRQIKSILHRVADIPGGLTVSVKDLEEGLLPEASLIGKGEAGEYVVCKTARLLEDATATATEYAVSKGNHLKVGDRLVADTLTARAITKIDRSAPEKDVLTLETTLGKALKAGEHLYQAGKNSSAPKVTPLAITGEDREVKRGENLFVSAWVIAVVREESAPPASGVLKTALGGIVYV